MAPTELYSDTVLEDFDHHFRVFAGPGAGKTYWLVKHMENVVRHSNRLLPGTRIGCISYTNVAVNEIVQRLGSAAERVEVSTIHSFLFRNIVKPYLHLITDDGVSLVNYARVDDHREHIVSTAVFHDWLKQIGLAFYLTGKKKGDRRYIRYFLERIVWQQNAVGEWHLAPVKEIKGIPQKVKENLWAYKSHYWQRGIIHHDDVLYFALRILRDYPVLRQFLSARFPYLFVDEFQDTHPIQTQIVRWLADSGTIVGVIGDLEQSIYGFLGAQREHFRDFSLPGQHDYTIRGNRRSTNQIIDFLNHTRGDGLNQTGTRNCAGPPVCVYVGTIEEKVPIIVSSYGEDLTILARTNPSVGEIRRAKHTTHDDVWDRLEKCDPARHILMKHVIAAGEYAHQGNFSFAHKVLVDGIRRRIRDPWRSSDSGRFTDLQRRGLAVSILEYLMTNYGLILDYSFLQVYQELDTVISQTMSGLKLKRITTGKIKKFAEETLYRDLANTVELTEETRLIRTIHKAKATEFESVLVVLDTEDELAMLIDPMSGDEEKRVRYVALSRARDTLLLLVPTLSDPIRIQLEGLGLIVF